MTVLSVDVAVDANKCDLFSFATQTRWLDLIQSGQVAGVGSGPPCESWSVARFRACSELKRPPRPLRHRNQLWGLCDVNRKEADQIDTGNILMGFSLKASLMQALSGGFSFLEHPDDPKYVANSPELAPSIWASELTEWLLQLPCFTLLRAQQGYYGGYSAKPTALLLSGVPADVAQQISIDGRTTKLPSGGSIGIKEGKWQTNRLKEYPEAFSMMIARQFRWWTQQTVHLPPDEVQTDLAWLRDLHVELEAEPRISEACPDYRGPRDAFN